MKAIKMKKIMEAYDRMRDAERSVDFYENKCHGRFPKDLEASKEELQEARKAFREITVPLNDTISEIEGKATARTLVAEEICKGITEVEKQLQGITKKAMKGVKFGYDVNAQSFPKAYKYIPMSTIFTAEFDGKEWRITSIFRGECGKGKCDILLTDEAKKAVLEKISRF